MIDFLIIGGTKCGSTSLADYVSQSTRVNFCRQKEPSLLNKAEFTEKYLDIYAGLFARMPGLKGEATPAYSDYSQVDTVIRNLKLINAAPKIIMAVRSQVKRIESSYMQGVKSGKIKPGLASEIELSPSVINRGMFGSVLQKYIQAFSKESVLVLNFDLLTMENSAELEKLKLFLGLENELPTTLPRSNPSIGGLKKPWILRFYKKYFADFWRTNRLPSLRFLVPLIKRFGKTTSADEAIKLNPKQVEALYDIYREDAAIFESICGWSYWSLSK